MPCVGNKFYEAVFNKKTRLWEVVWVRRGKDKPTVSLWAKRLDREASKAAFKERDWAKEYMKLLTIPDQTRFKCLDPP